MTKPCLIAQISDLHVNAAGAPGVKGLDAGAATEAAVRHLSALLPRPEMVLATGDLAATSGTSEEYARLAAALSELDMPVYLIPGNHDSRDGMRAAFSDHAYLPRSGFLHYVIDAHPVRLIGLDTTIPDEVSGELCAERLQWVDAQLSAAPDRPTLVFMHHPPMPIGISAFDEARCAGGEALGNILEGHPQVLGVTCGHVHRASQRRWSGTVLMTAPSTLVQAELALGRAEKSGWGSEPPACLLHYWMPNASGGGLVSHVSTIAQD